MYLIDTNVLSEVIRPQPNLAVVRKLLTTDPALRFASEITRYELRFGAMLRDDGEALWARIEQRILPLAHWLPVDLPAPFSPKSACTDPADIVMETSFSAFTPGKDLLTFVT